MVITDFKKVTLEINGKLIKKKDLRSAGSPTDDYPYWLFTFSDGDEIYATGNVTLILEDKICEK